MPLTYKNAGVDVQAGDDLVDWLQTSTNSDGPHQDKIVSGIGGFAALFRADFRHMKKPCLVSSTDGVGTKVKLAADFECVDTVGQDLVAMCVNDLITVGAEPLFFLDYYASGKLDLESAKKFLAGLRKACHQSNLALIGGETAEMPGVYSGKDFDCAGFAVGVVDQEKALGAHRVKAGQVAIAVASSGFHSNGYSLLRRVFADDLAKWKDILMRPTHLYANFVSQLLQREIPIAACANVTGGGLDNLPRVLKSNQRLNLLPWRIPAEFVEVKKRAKIPWQELVVTLNCGIGFVVIVEKSGMDQVIKTAGSQGFAAWHLGDVVDAETSGWDLDFAELEKLSIN